MAKKETLFWADQLANAVIKRKRYKYSEKKVPKFKAYTVKTSASLSGVLHIGRLSDTIRSATVYYALKDAGVKSKLIWVAENMDPLRKIPEGVPKSYEKYLGMPVSSVPDPDGCHKSYAAHHTARYLKVLDNFVSTKMEKFSTQDEYNKGHFRPYIKKVLGNMEKIKEILNKYRTNPLPDGWAPWTPICENCGKIMTSRIINYENNVIEYECMDYAFEKTVAKGCGHKGAANPLKDKGKLVWKSEWAAEWALWKIVAEGAGKEYQVPNSAWWVNAEISENIFDFVSPQPIFYEHLMIDGVKMSASLGNVVYPGDWLKVAAPELLKLYYNKRLMKTRSFSWKELPNLYDEYDETTGIFLGKKKLDNKKEEQHLKRLYKVSHGKKIEEVPEMSFRHATEIAQIFKDDRDIIKSLDKTGQYNKKHRNQIFDRIKKARIWLDKYAPEDMKFEVQEKVPKDIKLSSLQKKALKTIAKKLKEKDWEQKELFEEFYNISQEIKIEPKELFRAGYLVLLKKERGPKLAPFILMLGKEKVAELFEKV